jgi:hypothetical protein
VPVIPKILHIFLPTITEEFGVSLETRRERGIFWKLVAPAIFPCFPVFVFAATGFVPAVFDFVLVFLVVLMFKI